MSTIIVKEAEKKILVDFYLKKIEDMRNEIKSIEGRIREDSVRLQELGLEDLFVGQSGSKLEYGFDWTVARKAEYILEHNGNDKFLTIREIIDLMSDYELTIYSDAERKELSDKFASTLKQKVDKGDTFSRVSEDGAFKYGLLKWITVTPVAISAIDNLRIRTFTRKQ